MADSAQGDPVTNREKSSPPAPQALPELPRRLTDAVPVVAAGSVAWLIGFVVLLVQRTVFGTGSELWMWTCLAGTVFGLLGVGVISWQRAAARRGSRGAQEGL